MYVARSLLVPHEGGRRERGTIEDVGEKCCSLLICLANESMVMSGSNRVPLGAQKEFKNCSSNGLTLAAPSFIRGGERLWSRYLGGEEDLPPRRLTAVNPSASVMELYIVGASVDAVATNPSMA